jgi:hypothetical protein
MSIATRLAVEPIRSLGFASIGAGYLSVGDSLDHAASFLVFQNLTDASVMISFNGIDDNLALPQAGGLVLDITSNKAVAGGFFAAEGTQFYVKAISGLPTFGDFYITIFYGSEY